MPLLNLCSIRHAFAVFICTSFWQGGSLSIWFFSFFSLSSRIDLIRNEGITNIWTRQDDHRSERLLFMIVSLPTPCVLVSMCSAVFGYCHWTQRRGYIGASTAITWMSQRNDWTINNLFTMKWEQNCLIAAFRVFSGTALLALVCKNAMVFFRLCLIAVTGAIQLNRYFLNCSTYRFYAGAKSPET